MSLFQPMPLQTRVSAFDGRDFVFELLCGEPHKSSFVAFGSMWRREVAFARQALDRFPGAT